MNYLKYGYGKILKLINGSIKVYKCALRFSSSDNDTIKKDWPLGM